MDQSFDLLSSMSPKVSQHLKTIDIKALKKPPTMLALKKYFRRSSIHNRNDNVYNDTILTVESASTSSKGASSNSEASNARVINETPIVISDSEDSNSEILKETPEKDIVKPYKVSSNSKKNTSKRLSQEKFDHIQSWLSKVDNENDFKAYTELSSIVSDDNPGFKAPATNAAASSTFIGPLTKRFDELFEKRQIKTSRESKNGSLYRCEFDFKERSLIDKDKSTSKCDVIDDSMKKSDKYDDLNSFNESFQLKLNISLGSIFDGPKCETPKTTENTDEENVDSAIVEDCKNLLDNLYGNSWREKENQVLPSSEPRKKTVAKTKKPDHFNTERPKKTESIFPNPYLEINTNSNNLLKNLQIARFKGALESPWRVNLKNICDSDTESSDDSANFAPEKLNFDDDISSDKKSNRRNVKHSDSDSDKNDLLLQFPTKEVKVSKPDKNKIAKSKSKITNNVAKDKSYTFLESLSASVPISKCDISARIYRSSFKKYRDELTKKLFTLYNESIFDKAIPLDTVIEWSERMRGTAGYCCCKKITHRNGTVERKVKIVLSTKVLDSADRVRDTLVHEMCHAATWIVNQVSDGHGTFWKSWAHRAMKAFPELPPIKRCHQYAINTKYTYRCTDCGYSVGRHSKSLDIERKRCGYCYGKFEVLINKITKKGETKSVPATPKREVTGFALFVKENYANYKTPQRTHGEVMKVLGEKFAEMKVAKS